MSHFRHNYVPKKRKVKWKVVIPFLVLIAALVYLGINAVKMIKQEQVNQYGVCDLNDRKTRKLFEGKTYEEAIEIQDYLFYGETLSLFNQSYVLDQKDFMAGKTLTLRNVCDKIDSIYMLEQTADGQIPLEDLVPGYYEIYIMQDMKEKRLYSPSKIDETFYTVTRNGTNKKIRLTADPDAMRNAKDKEPFFDRAYLFLEVTEEKAPEDVYDIIIDPSGSSYDEGTRADYGYADNGLVEAEEMYKAALKMKEEFERLGLKVMIARNDEKEIVSTYGADGRLERGYKAKAKYYLNLRMMAANNKELKGTQIQYSSFASNKMASTVLKNLLENTKLTNSGNSGKGKVEGVLPCVKYQGYDGNMVIRESGGRILKAGQFSEKAQQENGAFAKDSRFGMQTIMFQFIYITNFEEVTYWRQDLDNIAVQSARGVAKYLQIKDSQ